MKQGDLVEVLFWDHCMNGDPMECKVWGKVEYLSRAHVEITTWELQTKSAKEKENNREFFSILKKVIISTRVLAPKR
jgi:hypothetical protein